MSLEAIISMNIFVKHLEGQQFFAMAAFLFHTLKRVQVF
jgi:hypothetical protein